MFQVRFHGRGGQGVVTAAALLASAALSEGGRLIIQDPTPLHQAELSAGLGRDGYMLINSTHSFDELGLDEFVSASTGTGWR
jgi:pyruvate ferredoxin oxidoreductase gamma subunit